MKTFFYGFYDKFLLVLTGICIFYNSIAWYGAPHEQTSLYASLILWIFMANIFYRVGYKDGMKRG